MLARPAFVNLWAGYPSDNSPCDGPWSNQCAIRLSIALNGDANITVDRGTYSEPKCAHGHARGAESLANWLWRRHLGRPRIYTSGATAKSANRAKAGIIFFKDCFTRDGESTRSGDHIDLWNNGLTKTYDDPSNLSAQVWFWEL